MTETLRDAYGIKEGTVVTLRRTDAKMIHAEKVTLRDFTQDQYEPDDGKWRSRCIGALGKLIKLASTLSVTSLTFQSTARRAPGA